MVTKRKVADILTFWEKALKQKSAFNISFFKNFIKIRRDYLISIFNLKGLYYFVCSHLLVSWMCLLPLEWPSIGSFLIIESLFRPEKHIRPFVMLCAKFVLSWAKTSADFHWTISLDLPSQIWYCFLRRNTNSHPFA